MPAKYSFTWASDVVSQLESKHARGLHSVCRILDVTTRDLARYLAHGDPLWNSLRNFIHFADYLFEYRGKECSDRDVAASYLQQIGKIGPERLVNRLTIGLDGYKLEEQVKGGGIGGPRAEDSLPSVLEDGYVQFLLEF